MSLDRMRSLTNWRRALQLLAFILPNHATARTAYGDSVRRTREVNSFFALLVAQGWPGFAFATLVRLILSVSVIAQSAYLRRHGGASAISASSAS